MSRRSSTSSDGWGRSPLVLLPDNNPLNDDNHDDDDYDDDYVPPPSSPLHLSRSSIFLYSLSPYLSLGSLLLPSTYTPLKYSLSALLLFAVLSAFVRQIWYMLARYMRSTNMEDVILDVFAKGRAKDNKRAVLRFLIRLGTAYLRILLATMYLRGKSKCPRPSHQLNVPRCR